MVNQVVAFDSEVLHRTLLIRVLIPEGKNLKWMLLLHGYGGNADSWIHASPIAALAEKENLAVIMPSCGNGYYLDTNEDIPRFLGEELVRFVRKTYPVSGDREDISIAGVSMGGFGALLIGAKYSHIFGRIASFSGSFIAPDVPDAGIRGILWNASRRYFFETFGDPDAIMENGRNPEAVALQAVKDGTLGKVLLICGRQDLLYDANQRVFYTLQQCGATVSWTEGPGGHSWEFWNPLIPDVIQWITG